MSNEYPVNVRWVKYNESGEVVADGATHNETTNDLGGILGGAILHDSPTATPATHMAIGTGGTPAKANDTALDNELHRVAIGSSTDNGTSLDLTATFPGASSGGELVREAALFTASSGGTMFNRVTLETEHFEWTNDADITITLSFVPVLADPIEADVPVGGSTMTSSPVKYSDAITANPVAAAGTVSEGAVPFQGLVVPSGADGRVMLNRNFGDGWVYSAYMPYTHSFITSYGTRVFSSTRQTSPQTVYEYDIKENSWTAIGTQSVTSFRLRLGARAGELFLLGTDSATNDAYIYTDSSDTISSVTTPSFNSTNSINYYPTGDEYYVTRGSDIHVYDPDLDSWTGPVNSFNTSTTEAGMAIVGDDLYRFGGGGPFGGTRVVEVYSITGDTVTTLNDLPNELAGISAMPDGDGTIYLQPSIDGAWNLRYDVYAYDIATDSYTSNVMDPVPTNNGTSDGRGIY